MNSHLNYLLAQDRANQLAQNAERARLADDARATDARAGRGGRATLSFRSLRLRIAGSRRLRARRA
jgi:hypothetical protein